jgi:hypothetical protein
VVVGRSAKAAAVAATAASADLRMVAKRCFMVGFWFLEN